MAIPIFDEDMKLAMEVMSNGNMWSMQGQLQKTIALALATERERCTNIAEAIDSGRGNEKEIAKAIREPRHSTVSGG